MPSKKFYRKKIKKEFWKKYGIQKKRKKLRSLDQQESQKNKFLSSKLKRDMIEMLIQFKLEGKKI